MVNYSKYHSKERLGLGRPRKSDYYSGWWIVWAIIISALLCLLVKGIYKQKNIQEEDFMKYVATKVDKYGFLLPISQNYVFANERADTTSSIINRLLAKYNSPMEGQGDNFVEAGWKYGIDPILLFAITGAESTFGKNAPPNFNVMGWDHGKTAFNSYRDCIFTVASKIATLPYYKEFREKKTIVSFARSYNRPYWASYVGKLQWFIEEFKNEEMK